MYGIAGAGVASTNDDQTFFPMSLSVDYLLEGGGALRTVRVSKIRVGDAGNLTSDTLKCTTCPLGSPRTTQADRYQ